MTQKQYNRLIALLWGIYALAASIVIQQIAIIYLLGRIVP